MSSNEYMGYESADCDSCSYSADYSPAHSFYYVSQYISDKPMTERLCVPQGYRPMAWQEYGQFVEAVTGQKM